MIKGFIMLIFYYTFVYKLYFFLSFFYKLSIFFFVSFTHLAFGHTDVAYSTMQENCVTLLYRGFTPAFPIYMLWHISMGVIFSLC